jgi:hypothetical protein
MGKLLQKEVTYGWLHGVAVCATISIGNDMSSVSSISGVSGTSTSEQIAMLQQRMFFYSQYAQANPPASTDYKALQNAVLTQNLSDAQEAFARLQVDSLSSAASSTNSTPATADTHSTLAAILSQEASSGIQNSSSLNVLA